MRCEKIRSTGSRCCCASQDVRAVVVQQRRERGDQSLAVGAARPAASPCRTHCRALRRVTARCAMQAWRAVRPLRVPRSSAKRSTPASSSSRGSRAVEAELARVVVDDAQIGLLVEGEERQQQPEAVRERDLLLGGLAGVEEAVGVEHRLAVLRRSARGSGGAGSRSRPRARCAGRASSPPSSSALSALPARVALLEGEVVAEQREALLAARAARPELGQLEQRPRAAPRPAGSPRAPNSPSSPRTADDLPVPRSP